MEKLQQMGMQAKESAAILACSASAKRDDALRAMAAALIKDTQAILTANQMDLEQGKQSGLTTALLDRLTLTAARIEGIAQAILDIKAQGDPIGVVDGGSVRPNGLRIIKTRVPLGVVGIIYEARPNVTADAAALCIKSGNAVILRGGKEALQSNRAIVNSLQRALIKSGLPANGIQLITDTARETAQEMMKLHEYIDVLIPRGGAGLIKTVLENATIPVIETGTGVCHIYVDSAADLDMAVRIVHNAKVSRPSVCNACETLLVHKHIANKALPLIKTSLDQAGVILRGDPPSCSILSGIQQAVERDWSTEYSDLILSVKVVESLEDAIAHIARYGTQHSECILTENYTAAQRFLNEVDAAAVYVNASTRFTDGGEFGFGAEIGISTQKLHARGPMGIEALTSIKYMIYGNGQIR